MFSKINKARLEALESKVRILEQDNKQFPRLSAKIRTLETQTGRIESEFWGTSYDTSRGLCSTVRQTKDQTNANTNSLSRLLKHLKLVEILEPAKAATLKLVSAKSPLAKETAKKQAERVKNESG